MNANFLDSWNSYNVDITLFLIVASEWTTRIIQCLIFSSIINYSSYTILWYFCVFFKSRLGRDSLTLAEVCECAAKLVCHNIIVLAMSSELGSFLLFISPRTQQSHKILFATILIFAHVMFITSKVIKWVDKLFRINLNYLLIVVWWLVDFWKYPFISFWDIT